MTTGDLAPVSDQLPPPMPATRWSLTLYVSGAGPRSVQAIATVRRICDEDLGGRVDLTVVDAAEDPAVVRQQHIVAVPTLVKHAPAPVRHLVGDFSDVAKVREGLDLGHAPSGGTRQP